MQTTTSRAQSETEALHADLAAMAEKLSGTKTDLARQKLLNQTIEIELSQAYAGLAAAQIAFQANKETHTRVVAVLRSSLADERAETRRLALLNARVFNTVLNARARIKRMAASNVGATLGESIPFVGIGVIVAGTTYEMYESCAAMDEMTILLDELDPSRVQDDEDSHADVCGVDIPTKDEIITSIKNSPSAAWSATQRAVGSFDWMKDVDGPNFSRVEAWFRHVF